LMCRFQVKTGTALVGETILSCSANGACPEPVRGVSALSFFCVLCALCVETPCPFFQHSTLNFTLKNHLRQGLSCCVRDAQRDIFHAKLLAIFPASPPSSSVGRRSLPAPLPNPPIFTPRRQPVPMRLHRRFFCRKPPRIPFVLVLELLAVFSFLRGINPSQKHFPIAR